MLKRGVIICLACAPLVWVLGCPMVGECTNDADCAAGEVCANTACVECVDDTDCGAGEVCENGACMEEPECTQDADCPAGETCQNEMCVAEAECTEDTDCAAGEVCTNGECVAGAVDCNLLITNVAAGETYYTTNECAECHGADGQGPPSIVDADCQSHFDNLSGADFHAGGTFEVTSQNAADLAAYLDSL